MWNTQKCRRGVESDGGGGCYCASAAGYTSMSSAQLCYFCPVFRDVRERMQARPLHPAHWALPSQRVRTAGCPAASSSAWERQRAPPTAAGRRLVEMNGADDTGKNTKTDAWEGARTHTGFSGPVQNLKKKQNLSVPHQALALMRCCSSPKLAAGGVGRLMWCGTLALGRYCFHSFSLPVNNRAHPKARRARDVCEEDSRGWAFSNAGDHLAGLDV
eukprot:gene24702-biopygen4434